MTVSLKAEEDTGARYAEESPGWEVAIQVAQESGLQVPISLNGRLVSKTVGKLISVVCHGSPHR